ncbi:MAG: hypothetical protein M0036_01820 [Desulfobacteraceae bacterium]|nr:hypothetical protein [Desulfobacteraceae bacterium]
MSGGLICPICKLEHQGSKGEDFGRTRHINCERCGKYSITETAKAMAISESLRPKLSAWIRDLNEHGCEPPSIDSHILKTIETGLPNYTPVQKQLVLLRNIERRTTYPGKEVHLTSRTDYPLAWASCEKELIYYLYSLANRKLLEFTRTNEELSDTINFIEISASGWEYLDEHSNQSPISDQTFVAMSFSNEMSSVWLNAIKPSIESAGYNAYRVDSTPHSDRIDIKIMAEIKNSKFLIADVTEQKQGVYFEAGYALGLSIPVIWTCRKNDFKNVHFDTKQYNHIRWEDETDLKKQLFNFISVIIGKRI